MEDNTIISVEERLREIEEKDPMIYKAIECCIKHIHNTYSDKYNPEDCLFGINTKELLLNNKTGQIINTYQIMKYVQRYNTVGKQKSYLVQDLFKGVHYFIFEIARRLK